MNVTAEDASAKIDLTMFDPPSEVLFGMTANEYSALEAAGNESSLDDVHHRVDINQGYSTKVNVEYNSYSSTFEGKITRIVKSATAPPTQLNPEATTVSLPLVQLETATVAAAAEPTSSSTTAAMSTTSDIQQEISSNARAVPRVDAEQEPASKRIRRSKINKQTK
jgi:recombination DNA repair RAD52 pathway protein